MTLGRIRRYCRVWGSVLLIAGDGPAPTVAEGQGGIGAAASERGDEDMEITLGNVFDAFLSRTVLR